MAIDLQMTSWKRSLLRTFALMATVALVNVSLAGVVVAQEETSVPAWLQERLVERVMHRRDNGEMMQLVRPIAESVSDGVVGVICGGRPVSLGTVVARSSLHVGASVPTTDAYVITKRSELSNDPIRVRLRDGRMFPARVAAVRRRSDLALLVIERDSTGTLPMLRPVTLTSKVPTVGSFLISPDRTNRVIGLGVMGAGPRRVAYRGMLGVQLNSRASTAGAQVEQILPNSSASEAGLESGDRIIAINGQMQNNRDSVMSTLRMVFPGEIVQLTIVRDGDTKEVSAKMREAAIVQESENDARVNGARNIRLSGFEEALQHDTVLNPDQCGGPLLNSDGQVIGVNIARAGRVVSYALPSSLVTVEVSSMIAEAGGK
ncbi:PDZ domain-containing protein [Rhodopirellula europaea]|uniref:PDZ/DHR/GLGF domain protein n=1 Tax=Rhodopirellula europaea 6C TaxID=1263867 RepID=M2A731_9BACT|nr:PDZ domain-containing protein [Rhodopirellula europaea]EMB16916.1 PDZ/DHR/GLGF domain protein [Rhodopirellula europaea 6C]